MEPLGLRRFLGPPGKPIDPRSGVRDGPDARSAESLEPWLSTGFPRKPQIPFKGLL